MFHEPDQLYELTLVFVWSGAGIGDEVDGKVVVVSEHDVLMEVVVVDEVVVASKHDVLMDVVVVDSVVVVSEHDVVMDVVIVDRVVELCRLLEYSSEAPEVVAGVSDIVSTVVEVVISTDVGSDSTTVSKMDTETVSRAVVSTVDTSVFVCDTDVVVVVVSVGWATGSFCIVVSIVTVVGSSEVISTTETTVFVVGAATLDTLVTVRVAVAVVGSADVDSPPSIGTIEYRAALLEGGNEETSDAKGRAAARIDSEDMMVPAAVAAKRIV